MNERIKIGDKVKTTGFFKGLEGTVVDIYYSNKKNYGIKIKVDYVTQPFNYPFASPGDVENFGYCDWEHNIELISR